MKQTSKLVTLALVGALGLTTCATNKRSILKIAEYKNAQLMPGIRDGYTACMIYADINGNDVYDKSDRQVSLPDVNDGRTFFECDNW